MKIKIFKVLSILFAIILITSSLVACGTSDKMALEEDRFVEESTNSVIADSTSTKVTDNRKIIEYVDLSVQTKEFDTLITGIEKEVAKLGGYIESSSISGNEYYSSNYRRADFTVRIPTDKSGSFTEYISENSTATNKSISTDDVTLTYVDLESRVKVLEAEKESLQGLLEKAQTMSDIISIREKLTEVISNIESYKSQLKTYDNLVSYSTVNIAVNEVEHTVVSEEAGVWKRIATNLKNNFSNVWNIIVNVFVFIVSIIPYLIPIAVVIIIVLIIRKLIKLKK